MKVLIIGVGSIGRRHLSNLQRLGLEDVLICDVKEERLQESTRDFGISKKYVTLEKAISENNDIDAAFVCSPSSLHIPHAIKIAENGISVFMEKPLSHNLDGIRTLMSLVNERDLVFMMGMCYRFHPVFLRLKEILDSGVTGNIYHVNYYGGHYLPDWHPDTDYRKEYTARTDLGGGFLLTSIHGLDNLRWLFGETKEAASFVDKVSDLEIDVDDMAVSILRMERGFYISSSGDFLQRSNQHRMVVAGARGTIICNFITGRIALFTVQKQEWEEEIIDFDINEMYLSEARHFLTCLEHKSKPAIDLVEGLKTLKLALSLRESSEKREFVSL